MTAPRFGTPTQAVSTRHLPESAGDLAPFLITDPVLVHRALQEVRSAGSPVAVHTSRGTFRHWATLAAATPRELVFLGPARARALSPWSQGDLLTSTPNDVKLQFTLATPTPVIHDGLPAWSGPTPTSLYRVQRRAAFRAQPLEPASLLLDPADPQTLWPVIDFTSRGLGLARMSGAAPMEGQVYPAARLLLGGLSRLSCRVTVCWGQAANPPYQFARAGVRIELDNPRERGLLDSMVVRAVFASRRR